MASKYYSFGEAVAQVKKMRKTGWPSAHAMKIENANTEHHEYYIIITHHKGCRCCNCPVVQENGYVSAGRELDG